MHILCLGLNHLTARLDLRERLSYDEQSLEAALSRSRGSGQAPGDGAVILATCNRVEVYTASENPSFSPLEDLLLENRVVDRSELAPYLYRLRDEQAVEHLFRVAAGLDSLVLGEAQILGQVSRALEAAQKCSSAGPALTRLFQSAVHAGKRARAETSIGRNPASVSSIAVRLAAQQVKDLASAFILVLGAGETAELTVEAFRKRGADRIVVVNRTLERAGSLAERWNAGAQTFEKLPQTLIQADILVSSTGAPHTLISKEMVEAVLPYRSGQPLVIIDIAVPRDVDPRVSELPGVSLYDIDALQDQLTESLASRVREVPRVEAILAEEMESFREYLTSAEVLPLISEIRLKAEEVRRLELEKTLQRLPHLSSAERQRIEALTNALVKKILHAPLVKLKAAAGSPDSAHYAAAARDLFGLDENAAPSGNKRQPGSSQGNHRNPSSPQP